MQNQASPCLSCNKNNVEYFQIDDVKSIFALCQECYLKKDNNKDKYQQKQQFISKYQEKIKNDFPSFYKVLQFKKYIESIKFWKTKLQTFPEVLSFLENENYTFQNFQLLIKFFSVEAKKMEKSANQLILFLFANKLDAINSISLKQQEQIKEKFITYLSGIFVDQKQFQTILDYIEATINNLFSKIPQEYQIIGQYFCNDEKEQQDCSKYFGQINFLDQKHGRGVFLKNEIIYYGIFENDTFKYGVKFEFISKGIGQFFFGQFNQELIQNNGKMIAYKIEDQIMFQEYDGQYNNGLRNGKGKFIWSKNKKNLISYDGEWVNDLQHGHGLVIKDDFEKNFFYNNGIVQQSNANSNSIKQSQFPFQQNVFQSQFLQSKNQNQELEQIQQTSTQFFIQNQQPQNKSQIEQSQKQIPYVNNNFNNQNNSFKPNNSINFRKTTTQNNNNNQYSEGLMQSQAQINQCAFQLQTFDGQTTKPVVTQNQKQNVQRVSTAHNNNFSQYNAIPQQNNNFSQQNAISQYNSNFSQQNAISIQNNNFLQQNAIQQSFIMPEQRGTFNMNQNIQEQQSSQLKGEAIKNDIFQSNVMKK